MTFREMRKQLERVRIVLVRPNDSRNVGSVCRAMKTMGIERLSVVGTVDLNEFEAKTLAVHAADVYDSRRCVPTLREAVAGCALIAGTTRRWGKKRKSVRLTPSELAAEFSSMKTGEIAVVFGNEATGLSDDELASCTTVVTIPSSPDFPSLNLSHAVQIVCYELYSRLHADAGKQFYSPIDVQCIGELVQTAIESLRTVGFFKLVGSQDMEIFLRDVLVRARLSRAEADRFAALFRKIAGIAKKNRRGDTGARQR